MNRHGIYWTSVALLGAMSLLAGCGGPDAKESAGSGGEAAEPMAVEVVEAAFEKVSEPLWATGSVQPIRRVQPGTKILGRVERVAVREGDRVERGQLLARLESSDLDAAVAQAEAALTMARAELENARAHHERMVGLHERGSVTDKSLEDAVAGFEVRRAAVARAEANLAAARVMLGYAEIRSPLAGWVAAKHVEAGDMVAPGAPFFVLEDLSPVKVEVQVPESEILGLQAGGEATVEILGMSRAATVDRVVPAGDPRSRTFAVQLLLDNAEGVLKSGMFARVAFAGSERDVLRVPASALVIRGQLEGLFVVDGTTARLRWVKTGRAEAPEAGEENVEILSGLDAGERYVLDPPAALVDGSTLRVTERSSSEVPS